MSEIGEVTTALRQLGHAMGELREAWEEFGRMRRTVNQVRHARLVREDPAYVPYVFESAEKRAARRHRLHQHDG